MYNKTKRAIWLVAAILGIVLGGIEWYGGFTSVSLSGIGTGFVFSLLFFTGIIDLGVGIAMVVFGAVLCKNPEDPYTWNNKGMVTMIVFNGILLLCGIVGGSLFYIVFPIIAGGFAIAAITISPEISESVQRRKTVRSQAKMGVGGSVRQTSYNNDTESQVINEYQNKINDLKRLVELHVITEEQFKEASEKIFKELTTKL